MDLLRTTKTTKSWCKNKKKMQNSRGETTEGGGEQSGKTKHEDKKWKGRKEEEENTSDKNCY
jgi:hypothetical protein